MSDLTLPSHPQITRTQWLWLPVFLVAVIAISSAIGISARPGSWYQGLVKPSFTPPNTIFAPVWTLLYAMIAIAGWRVIVTRPQRPAAWLWALQLLLNWIWSPIMFGLHMIGAAFVLSLAMWVAAAAFIAVSWKNDRLAAGLFVPYLAWLSFASLLAGSLYRLNP